jgi:short-subunit dehydrogenase
MPTLWAMQKTTELYETYGPWALVTGAARGLGAGFAEKIAAAGLNLLLVDVDAESLEERGAALRESHGVEVRTLALDLRREDFLDELMPRIEGLEINLLVNNAGIAKVAPFLPQARTFLVDQVHVNVRAVLLLTHAIANTMLERGRGGIIIVSSGAAWNGSALNANYAATKAYDLVFAESLWAELGPMGIDVLGFMPTSTDTTALWSETPNSPRRMVMGVEETVETAFAHLGRGPSIFAGRMNRVAHRFMRTFLPRSALIRIASSALRKMSRFPEPRSR